MDRLLFKSTDSRVLSFGDPLFADRNPPLDLVFAAAGICAIASVRNAKAVTSQQEKKEVVQIRID